MKQNIEQLVNKILRGAKISSPPIKSEILAESYFDLDFDCVELNENELAGLKVAEKKIYLNEGRKDDLAANFGLKNFTVAHELGHWVLHRNLIGEHTRQIEREADKFATYLLMPENFVREEFAKINSARPLRCIPAEMKLRMMSDKFCVSRRAMAIRLSQRELKLIYVDFKDYSCYRSKEEFLEKTAGQMLLL